MNQWNEDLRDPQLDENDPVWRLLEESPRPEPDAWFTVRTLARCRLAEEEPKGLAWKGLWRWMLGSGFGFALAVILMVTHVSSVSVTSDKKKNAQEAFEIMAAFNSSDTDSTSSTSWQDSSL